MIKSLIINPGSTSTKLGIFEDETLVSEETLRHTTEEIAQFDKIVDQVDFRKEMILAFLKDKGEELSSFNVIVGRGGLLKPIPSGTYAVTDKLIEDLKIGVGGEHASNLGGILAKALADEVGVPSYIVDPVVVDELEPVARISGVPELPRVSIFHALNQKAVAKRYAKEVGKAYTDLNLIVVHMGGGVSVGAHTGGRIVDVFNALSGEGAFSPERAGGVPPAALVDLCFSGKYTKDEIKKKLIGNGGYNALVGTNNAQEVYKRSLTDENVKLVFDAFIYQVSKDIGAMATVLKGKVDQIILTGGIAYGEQVTADIKERVSFIAPVTIYPGEDELLALAQGALRVMNGEEEARTY
ncbi:MAG: butyrate kinase [Eubacterium sp.]|nr:butyrate kinase [Eubacterium sp.]MBP3807899.1 butyrate kinase [Eubacterium sp.]MEE3399258.1 butyrate kinase [Eubacterium sp.]